MLAALKLVEAARRISDLLLQVGNPGLYEAGGFVQVSHNEQFVHATSRTHNLNSF
jgi:hypothetical protein